MKLRLMGHVALIAVCVAGCGSDELAIYEVGGVVTWKGQPLPEATVTFTSDTAPAAIGMTNENGEFELNTLGRAGAAPGTYGVAITAMKDSRVIPPEEAQSIKADELAKIRKSLIPAKYAHPRTSGLTQTVTDDPEKNQFTFDLKD
jgi:hypothetical protein